MKLLLLDTCGAEGSLALVDTELARPVVAEAELGGRTASERLLPELARVMGAAGWRVGELTAVGVVSGPGSFTGVRVGLAAAKGLCEAGGVGLVMVSRLRVLAEKAGVGAAALDAGRGEFFVGRYGDGGGEALLGREAVLGIAGAIAVCEEAVAVALEALLQVRVEALRAVDALSLVRARVERGDLDDVAAADATYLRRTEQEMLERLRQRAG